MTPADIEALARAAAATIQDEMDACGLAGGTIYEDFAVEVAQRVSAQVRAQALEDASKECALTEDKRRPQWKTHKQDEADALYHAACAILALKDKPA